MFNETGQVLTNEGQTLQSILTQTSGPAEFIMRKYVKICLQVIFFSSRKTLVEIGRTLFMQSIVLQRE